jgi:diadenosine tetraphosphatase ApaH/serine/threonine PP2A family protein phosphatase
MQRPAVVVRAIHAEVDVIHEVFTMQGRPPETGYVILGDFVNYGQMNIATICIILGFAVLHPEDFVVLRGEHESRRLTQKLGCYDELQAAYKTERAWLSLMEAFDSMPLAARVNKDYFCVNSGVAARYPRFSRLNEENRFLEIPRDAGGWGDLMRAVPGEVDKFGEVNGVSQFGATAVDEWLRANNVKVMVRSRQLCDEGHRAQFEGQVHTIWSAPNFLGWVGNNATVFVILDRFGEKGKKGWSVRRVLERPDGERIAQRVRPAPGLLDALACRRVKLRVILEKDGAVGCDQPGRWADVLLVDSVNYTCG